MEKEGVVRMVALLEEVGLIEVPVPVMVDRVEFRLTGEAIPVLVGESDSLGETEVEAALAEVAVELVFMAGG